DLFFELADFPAAICKPIGGPYAIELPAEPFEHLLPQTVTVTRATCRVIRCAVALYAEHEMFASLRVTDGKIKEISRDADLRLGFDAGFENDLGAPSFERRFVISASPDPAFEAPGASVLQVGFQSRDAGVGTRLNRDVLRFQRRDEHYLFFRSCEQDIEPPVSYFAIYRTKALHHRAAWDGRPVNRRNDDDVSLVALNVFEVLHHERFERLCPACPVLLKERIVRE